MITPKDITELTHQTPFKPFKVHMTDGRLLEITHPDSVLVLRNKLIVGVGHDPESGTPDHAEHCSMLHVVRLEETTQ